MEKRILVMGLIAICLSALAALGFSLRKKIANNTEHLSAAAKETIAYMLESPRPASQNRETIYLDAEGGNGSSVPREEKFIGSDTQKEAESGALEKETEWCDVGDAQTPSRENVILNEVAWMGDANSANNEWIELKNMNASSIDVKGWQLMDKSGQIKIALGHEASAEISAGGFYLLERTDDATIPGITAHELYRGALSDADEGLRLFDSRCELIDEVFANEGGGLNWPAGDKLARKTMERNANNPGWHTSQNQGGTPRAENSVPQVAVIPSPESEAEATSTESSPPPVSPPEEEMNLQSHLVINEIQITGESAADEFIELYNPTANSITLTGWSLKRKSSSGAEYSLVVASRLEGKMIPAHGYLLLANEEGYKGSVGADVVWPKSNSIAANNTVLLYAPDGSIADKVGFGSAADFEGSSIAGNPGARESISRTNGVDSDNNAADFVISPPTPQSASN